MQFGWNQSRKKGIRLEERYILAWFLCWAFRMQMWFFPLLLYWPSSVFGTGKMSFELDHWENRDDTLHVEVKLLVLWVKNYSNQSDRVKSSGLLHVALRVPWSFWSALKTTKVLFCGKARKRSTIQRIWKPLQPKVNGWLAIRLCSCRWIVPCCLSGSGCWGSSLKVHGQCSFHPDMGLPVWMLRLHSIITWGFGGFGEV